MVDGTKAGGRAVADVASKAKVPLIAGGTAIVGAAAGVVLKDRLGASKSKNPLNRLGGMSMPKSVAKLDLDTVKSAADRVSAYGQQASDIAGAIEKTRKKNKYRAAGQAAPSAPTRAALSSNVPRLAGHRSGGPPSFGPLLPPDRYVLFVQIVPARGRRTRGTRRDASTLIGCRLGAERSLVQIQWPRLDEWGGGGPVVPRIPTGGYG